ncbi:MAG: NmrA family NAD(P)-binding protein [Rhodocyclaceae bacterium]|nr:NmrA family NAD(P)-binding protein [Rhodocyclaceae bacterium]
MNQLISSSPTVLVLGAKGRFGTAAVNAFAAAGWQVRAQSRRADASYPAGVTAITADAMDSAARCAAAKVPTW